MILWFCGIAALELGGPPFGDDLVKRTAFLGSKEFTTRLGVFASTDLSLPPIVFFFVRVRQHTHVVYRSKNCF